MKSIMIAVLVAVITVLGIGMVFAMQEKASVEKGKTLFNDVKLGTSGKSCNTCHADGKGLDKAGTKSDLPNIINACISTPLKGAPLKVNSVEMQSLVLYIKSIKSAGEKKPAPAPTKKPAVGC